MKTFYPGTRVKVFDTRLFRDDESTPLSVTVRPATVVCWYGYAYKSDVITNGETWRYPSCIDVIFDYAPTRISHGHFTAFVEKLE